MHALLQLVRQHTMHEAVALHARLSGEGRSFHRHDKMRFTRTVGMRTRVAVVPLRVVAALLDSCANAALLVPRAMTAAVEFVVAMISPRSKCRRQKRGLD